MIKEFEPRDIAAGVAEALEGNGVVIRGLIDRDQARAIAQLAPSKGRKRVYVSPRLLADPALVINGLEATRPAIRQEVHNRLGRTATLGGLYVMRPDVLRAGETHMHIDGRGAVVSGSLNLDLGEGEPLTEFLAHRVSPSDAMYSAIQAAWDQSSVLPESIERCLLDVGDMAIVTRGVVHGAVAPDDRRSLTCRVRGFVAGDFR